MQNSIGLFNPSKQLQAIISKHAIIHIMLVELTKDKGYNAVHK